MEVRTLLKRGTDHHVYCEDDLFHFNIGSTYVGAVFDGCSTGIKSHFASSLYGKILKSYTTGIDTESFETAPLKIIATSVLAHIYHTLRITRTTLILDYKELLSTMVFVVIRKEEVYILVSGDGCVLVDDEEYRIESEENAPDYLAYHLNDFKEALDSCKTYEATVTKSLSICSDGIYSFTNKEGGNANARVMDLLLKDEALLKSDAMLSRKHNLLTKEGTTNYDDLSIIRFIL